jgi:hypothetical protein
MKQKRKLYIGVSEPEEIPAATPEPYKARTYVPEAVTSHRERDDDYPTGARLSDTVRVIDCKDGVQWILQRRRGDQWQGVSFCRTRAALIREAKRVLGHAPEALRALPEHHHGFVEMTPRCKVCGRIKRQPTGGLPRHLFCLAERKPAQIMAVAASAARCPDSQHSMQEG